MTVSRAVNGGASIKEETRAKVLAAIAETGYRPSSVARALATKRASRIGVVVHAPTQFGPKSTLIAIERLIIRASIAPVARVLGDGVQDCSAQSLVARSC